MFKGYTFLGVVLTIYTYGLVSFFGRHIFWSKPSKPKSRIRPLALHPMLALHPPPVEGKFPGISLSLGIVVDQGMPRTRGHLGGPQIMGWTA